MENPSMWIIHQQSLPDVSQLLLLLRNSEDTQLKAQLWGRQNSPEHIRSSARTLCSEMFEANRWHSNPLYHAPMAIVRGEHVFLGDIVYLEQEEKYAKVKKFLNKVRLY